MPTFALLNNCLPAAKAHVLQPFLGRRLQAAWQQTDEANGAVSLWLAFGEQAGAADFVRLSATPARILPGCVEGGGPTAPTLTMSLADALPADPGSAWQPFASALPDSAGPLADWALTEVWQSEVVCNVAAPGGDCLRDVCAGLGLHFSHTRGVNAYGCLLGVINEHHDLDALPRLFCDEGLPPLLGGGPWVRVGYLKEDTRLDDAAVRHFSPQVFGSPALAGCTAQLIEALAAFSRWFEAAPPAGWLTPAGTRRWLANQRQHLRRVCDIVFHSDLILQRSTCCGEDLQADVAALGLGSWFSEAWAGRDGAGEQDGLRLPGRAMLAEIRAHYAPVREAYRQWFVLLRQACLDESRRLVRWRYVPTEAWLLTLDAALTRGSVAFDALAQLPGACWLRDDFRDAWQPDEDCAWYVAQGYLARRGPQDVLIEGDEERGDSLRLTWWPMPQRRDRVLALRVPHSALLAWWERMAQGLGCEASQFEQVLAWQQGRPAVAEHWPSLLEILAQHEPPPRWTLDPERLPPFTVDDIRSVFLQQMQGRPLADWPSVQASGLAVVWAFDSNQRFVPLLVGRDVHPLAAWSALERPAERVCFPAAWPATWVGRGSFYLMWSHSHWREERAEGLGFRPYNWLLPVMRRVLVDEGSGPVPQWRWGAVDMTGRFVLPCQFPAMGFPQRRGLGEVVMPELPLPPGRREPWCWLWVGEAEHAKGCWWSDRDAARGRVVEAWSGAEVLPPGRVAYRLADHFALVGDAAAAEAGVWGIFNLATGRQGPLCWRYIDTFYLSIVHCGPAQCFETGLWTYVDDQGEALLPADYASAGRIDSGLAIVQLGLAQAEAQGLALDLPDGQRQGPVGVFGPRGMASLGEWFLAPQWREVLGEYDGYFVVQDVAGLWGMVTPAGEPVTRFLPRSERDEFNGGVLRQVIDQFKRCQRRRFLGWLRAAVGAPDLGMMAGKLHSSFGRYDYGALNGGSLPVRLVCDVMPAAGSCGSPEQLETPLLAGEVFSWRPAQRNYFSSIDLRTHLAIGPRASDGDDGRGYHGIHVPWHAVRLDLPPRDWGDESEALAGLLDSQHVQAADDLLAALGVLVDEMDREAVSAFSPAMQACSTLESLLVHLLMDLATNARQPYCLMLVEKLTQDLQEIDFANVLADAPEVLEEAEPVSESPGRPWDRSVPAQAPWSAVVWAAHAQALRAYRVWEPLFLRCVMT